MLNVFLNQCKQLLLVKAVTFVASQLKPILIECLNLSALGFSPVVLSSHSHMDKNLLLRSFNGIFKLASKQLVDYQTNV